MEGDKKSSNNYSKENNNFSDIKFDENGIVVFDGTIYIEVLLKAMIKNINSMKMFIW